MTCDFPRFMRRLLSSAVESLLAPRGPLLAEHTNMFSHVFGCHGASLGRDPSRLLSCLQITFATGFLGDYEWQ